MLSYIAFTSPEVVAGDEVCELWNILNLNKQYSHWFICAYTCVCGYVVVGQIVSDCHVGADLLSNGVVCAGSLGPENLPSSCSAAGNSLDLLTSYHPSTINFN